MRDIQRLLAVPFSAIERDLDPGDVQTPAHRNLFSAFLQPEESGGLDFLGGELPDYLQGARAGYFTLIFRSMLCANECLHIAESAVARSFPGLSREEVLEIGDWESRILWYETPEQWEQLERTAGHSMIALGLLADPISVYKKVTSKNGDLKVAAVEDELDEDNWELYRKWRNVIFHVSDIGMHNPADAEIVFLTHSPLVHRYEKIVKGLQRFFLGKDADGKVQIAGEPVF